MLNDIRVMNVIRTRGVVGIASRQYKRALSSQTVVRVKDTVSGEKIPLTAGDRGTDRMLSWYSCGPTVYDKSHLGHARTYVSVDILQRILKNIFGVDVLHVMGITDIDDKIINRAAQEQREWRTVAHQYESDFFRDMSALNVLAPIKYARVSEHIPEIIDFIARIEDRDLAYQSSDGSVYFDTANYSSVWNFNKFGQSTSQPRSGSFIGGKRRAADFALWKSVERSLPGWDSPWGYGRPGWHIECSAMIDASFGKELDVHAGGVDLQFPHHENEIAQCTACYYGRDTSEAKPWPRIFVHTGHLHIHGQKMSKSLKNFVSIEDFLKEYSANDFRMFCLLHKYNANMEYSAERMQDAQNFMRKISNCRAESYLYLTRSSQNLKRWHDSDRAVLCRLSTTRSAVVMALADDFDTPRALHHIAEFARFIKSTLQACGNQSGLAPELVHYADNYVASMFDTFGLEHSVLNKTHTDNSDMLLDTLLRFRNNVRLIALKDNDKRSTLSLCDELRDDVLPSIGISLEDRKDGSVWKRINK